MWKQEFMNLGMRNVEDFFSLINIDVICCDATVLFGGGGSEKVNLHSAKCNRTNQDEDSMKKDDAFV